MGFNNTNYLSDFYSYDPVSNQWSTEEASPGQLRYHTFCYSIGNVGYVGSGANGTMSNPNFIDDVWEFIPGITGINQNEAIFSQTWFDTQNNSFHIELNVKAVEQCMIKIFNQNGQLVMDGKTADSYGSLQFKINSKLSPGIYLYSILINSTQSKTGKFLVK